MPDGGASPVSKFLAICDAIHHVTTAVCVFACLALASVMMLIVLLRYGFSIGFIELQDLATYIFAVLVILSVPVCLRLGGHVRVEVISEKLSERYARFADIAAILFFLIPVFALIIGAGWRDLAYSWSIREASMETGGLPGLFIVKTALPVGAALMILQGLAMILRGGNAR
jgi:TRAP-type mannitol/chloroaromatic compound transport system permease small subunit